MAEFVILSQVTVPRKAFNIKALQQNVTIYRNMTNCHTSVILTQANLLLIFNLHHILCFCLIIFS